MMTPDAGKCSSFPKILLAGRFVTTADDRRRFPPVRTGEDRGSNSCGSSGSSDGMVIGAGRLVSRG